MQRYYVFGAAALLVFCSLYRTVLAQEGLSSEEPKSNQAPAISSSPEAQMAEGQSIVTRGEKLSTRVSNMLESARKDADIIRITCLNEKLSQINANLRNAQNRLEDLSTAVNADRRNHEYTVLTVIGQKLQTLDQESNQCIGQDIFETGATRVETDIDPSIVPDEDSRRVLEIPPAAAAIAPPASPTD